jgi:hypothetical protein
MVDAQMAQADPFTKGLLIKPLSELLVQSLHCQPLLRPPWLLIVILSKTEPFLGWPYTTTDSPQPNSERVGGTTVALTAQVCSLPTLIPSLPYGLPLPKGTPQPAPHTPYSIIGSTCRKRSLCHKLIWTRSTTFQCELAEPLAEPLDEAWTTDYSSLKIIYRKSRSSICRDVD